MPSVGVFASLAAVVLGNPAYIEGLMSIKKYIPFSAINLLFIS
jgi:hypothetical protein